jgi:hypothetical protein
MDMMFNTLSAIFTLSAPFLIACTVRMLVPGKKKGVVLAIVLAALVIPARNLLERLIHRGDDAIQVGWFFAIFYSLVTGMIGLVVAEAILARKERRAREQQWTKESSKPSNEQSSAPPSGSKD